MLILYQSKATHHTEYINIRAHDHIYIAINANILRFIVRLILTSNISPWFDN